MDESPVPALLAVCGIAAEFCAQPEIWPLFDEFMQEGSEKGTTGLPREALHTASSVILAIVSGLQQEMIADQFADLLGRN